MNPFVQDYHNMSKQALDAEKSAGVVDWISDKFNAATSRFTLGKHHKSIRDTLETSNANRLQKEFHNEGVSALNKLGTMDRLRLMLSEFMGKLFDKIGIEGHSFHDRSARIRRDAVANVLGKKLGVSPDQVTDEWKDSMLGGLENYADKDTAKDFLTGRIKNKGNALNEQLVPLFENEKDIQVAAHKQLVDKVGGQDAFNKLYAENGGEWYRDQILGENGLAFQPENVQDPGSVRLFNAPIDEQPAQVSGLTGKAYRMFEGGYEPKPLPGPTKTRTEQPAAQPAAQSAPAKASITNPIGSNLKNSFNSFMNNNGAQIGLA